MPTPKPLDPTSTHKSLKNRLSNLMERWINPTPRTVAISKQGRGHYINQDAAIAATQRRVAVADGVSNSYKGELAAFHAVSAFAGSSVMTSQELYDIAIKADENVRNVYRMLECDETKSGYCTLLVAELEGNSRVNLIHIGDSRAYLITFGFWGRTRVTQLTEDQTYRALRSERPGMEIPTGYDDVMYQAIGTGISLPEKLSLSHKLPPGSIILLCTDGVFKGMREPLIEIAELASRHQGLESFVNAVVKRGQQGSDDDVSAAAIRAPSILGARPSLWLLLALVGTATAIAPLLLHQ